MEGGFSASLHLYISIAKRPSLTILPDIKKKQIKHPSSPWTPTEHRFLSSHFFVGKLPINATLKFDGTALYIPVSVARQTKF
jgi:hypothetical protein